MNFKTWLENFDNATNFLLNPENSNKTWDQLEDEFRKSGGQIIGAGRYSSVFSHPKWNYILKKYNDPLYTAFVRFAYNNPHPAFPKFFGPPKKIIPQYRRYKSSATAYIVRVEKLEPIDRQLFDTINNLYHRGMGYLRNKDLEDTKWDYGIDRFGRHDIRDDYYGRIMRGQQEKEPTQIKVKHFQDVIDAIKLNPAILNVFQGIDILSRSGLKGVLDMHAGNLMKRTNGDIVLIDPFWEGSNPYADAAHARNMEIDAYGDYGYDEPPPPDIMGGKLPKRVRPKKANKPVYTRPSDDDDTPF